MKYTKLFLIILLLIVLSAMCFINTRESMENKAIDLELVVSRYNENLEWLKEEPFNKYPVICYNKGPNKEFYKPDNMKVVNVENVGRCDHTYIYHIVKNYDNLSKHTMFLPGSCNMPNKNYKATRWIGEIEKTDKGVFIGLNSGGGIKQDLYGFQLDNWAASDEKNRSLNPENSLKLSSIRPFGKWYEKHFGDSFVPYYTLGGIMGIEKSSIIQHPKSYYENLLSELDNSSNPEVGHYFERAWGAVFHPMNNIHFIDELA